MRCRADTVPIYSIASGRPLFPVAGRQEGQPTLFAPKAFIGRRLQPINIHSTGFAHALHERKHASFLADAARACRCRSA